MDSKAIADMLVEKVPNQVDEHEGEEVDDGQLAVAEEAMEALKAGDAKAFATALRSFFAMV